MFGLADSLDHGAETSVSLYFGQVLLKETIQPRQPAPLAFFSLTSVIRAF